MSHNFIKKDWRTTGFYSSDKPCDICGSIECIGIEPRFGYSTCEEHSKLPPVTFSSNSKRFIL